MRNRFGASLLPGLVLLLSACAGAPPQADRAGQDAAAVAQAERAPAPVEAVREQPSAVTRTGAEGRSNAPVAALKVSAPVVEPRAEPAPQAATPAAENPDSPYVFVVTMAEKDASHPYYGVGSRQGFLVNGVQGKPLVLVRGKTYTFKVDTGVQHDFYLSLTGVGWGGTPYTDGVEGQFIYKGVTTFTPGAKTPGLLYYACRNHKNMGGAIYVVDPGEESLPIAELEARAQKPVTGAAGAPPARAQAAVTQQQVDQKIQFADMFIHRSDTAKRIEGSGNSEALALHESSRSRFASAKEAYARASYEESLGLVDEAMRLMSDAARILPKESQMEGQRQRFEDLLRGTRDYETSYKRNYDQIVAKKGGVKSIDLEAIHLAIDQAQTLAKDGQYPQAIGILNEAQATLTTALAQLLAEESLTYELTFATPKDEYEHELSRYLGYEELIPLAIEQRQPPKETADMMNKLIDRAREIKGLSEPEAAKGNYQEAILMLQGASDHIERALRLIGVR